MPIELAPLPYDKAALEPHISARTLEFHHGKHHAAYVKKTNELIAGTPLESAGIETIVRKAKADGDTKLFNQSAQVWNHGFQWQSFSPSGGGAPTGELAQRLERDLGGVETFAEAFKKEATEHFASGWAWLVLDGDTLKVASYHDADTPLVHGVVPLVTLDLWEHAYYLDYQNLRPDYVATFLSNLINWDFAAVNLAAREGWRTAA